MTDKKRSLTELYQEMSSLDSQIVGVLEKRAKLSKIAHELRSGDRPEALPHPQNLAEVLGKGTSELPAEDLKRIFREIYAAALSIELPARVAVAGVPGSLIWVAAQSRFGVGSRYLEAGDALGEVEKGRADFAIVPYESRLAGTDGRTIVRLSASELRISGVIDISESLHVYGKSGAEKEIDRLYASPSERARAAQTLSSTYPKVNLVEATSPEAACALAAAEPGAGALAAEPVGERLGLSALRKNIVDGDLDAFRFAVAGPRPSPRTGNDATALAFTILDSPGALLDALKPFSERGVNLLKIYSRPSPSAAYDYLFFLELVGHATDRVVVPALEELRHKAKFLKVLGSYPQSE